MTLSFRPKEFLAFCRVEGPLFAAIVPWMLVLLLHQLPISQRVWPDLSLFYALVLGNMASALVIACLFTLFLPLSSPLHPRSPRMAPRVTRRWWGLLALFFLGEVAQILYCQGTPLTWLMTGAHQSYICLELLLNRYLEQLPGLLVVCGAHSGRWVYAE